jgi:Nuclease-related domain
VDGQIAQIDHLLISRMLNFYMLETKNFAGDVTITPHGEFSVKYGAEKIYNIPSPIEQSKRHENVLRRLLTKLDIVGRAGMDLQFKHVVLVDPKAAINRPNAKTFNTSMVIAADQFRTWHLAHVDKDISTTDVLFGMLNFKSTDALKQVAEKICRQHRPENLLHLPDWLQPQPAKSQKEVIVNQSEQGGRKKLICLTCNSKISYDEGKFCWNNDKRFKGGQYCRTHQAAF